MSNFAYMQFNFMIEIVTETRSSNTACWKRGQSQYKQKCMVNEFLHECGLTPGNILESKGT